MTVRRSASLHLRSAAAEILWPAAAAEQPPIAVVHADRALAEALCDDGGMVVVRVDATAVATAVGWVAEHGAELGGDPRRLVVAFIAPAEGEVRALAASLRESLG